MASVLLAWREGRRITGEDNLGYADFVSDAEIIRHAAQHMDEGEYETARWCLAVITVRLDERKAKAQELQS